MAKFDLKLEKKDSKWTARVLGTIDEDVDFAQFSLSTVGSGSLDLYLGDIRSINSCGIREWIKWIQGAGPAARLTYHECPKIIVDQINMVQGFLPTNGRVDSFYVPFYSEASGMDKSVLFKRGQEYSDTGDVSVPVVKDDKGNEMELDVVEGKYFKFLKNGRP